MREKSVMADNMEVEESMVSDATVVAVAAVRDHWWMEGEHGSKALCGNFTFTV